jgi:hypothetical protein
MGISNTLARRLQNYDDPNSIGSRLRARRSAHLLSLLDQVHLRQGKVSVIDVGGTQEYWSRFPDDALERFNVTVTVVNLPGTPNPDDSKRFRYIEGDGCAMNWVAGRDFDIAHSNSVLEHVGQWSRMRAFAAEVRRVASAYVVQTPYFWFPIEPHFMVPFFHWLPESSRAKLLVRLPLGHIGRAASLDEAITCVQSAQLVDQAMFRTLFPDGRLHVERLAGVPKSLVAVRNAA